MECLMFNIAGTFGMRCGTPMLTWKFGMRSFHGMRMFSPKHGGVCMLAKFAA